MANRFVVVAIALVVGGLLYFGPVFLGGVIANQPGLFTAAEVTVSDGSMYLDRTGRPVVVGEVVNDRRNPIANVTVTVAFYDDGDHVTNITTGPELSPIPARSRSPYLVRLPDSTVRPDSYEVFMDYDTTDDSVYRGLEVSDVRAERIGQDRVQLAGSVDNTGGRTVDPVLVVIFYDANETVIGIRSGRTSPSTLEPGETGQFLILYNTLGDVPSKARVYSDQEVVVATTE